MKLAIADVGDAAYDSNVFIEAGSLTTEPPDDVVPGAPTDVTATPGDGSAHGRLDGARTPTAAARSTATP